MSSDGFEMASEVDAAWVRFQARLGDHVAALGEDESFCVQVETGVDDCDLEGATPYLQFMAWGEDMLRSEVVSNAFLDPRYALVEESVAQLIGAGWEAPASAGDNYHLDAALAEADRVAAMSVAALRDVFGVPHPSFLLAEGLERDPGTPVPVEPGPVHAPADDEVIYFPHGAEELQEQVDLVVTNHLGLDELEHDEDGDIPIVAGSSVVYVRVSTERPAIELFAEVVVEVEHLERLAVELGILNRTHAFAKFYARGPVVVMKHVLAAGPFVPMQLKMVLAEMVGEIDELAADLAARVGGHRFLEVPDEDPAIPEGGALHPAMVGMLEVLQLRRMSSAMVATLFDHDRATIVEQLVGVRTGRIDCGDLDHEVVLDHLRRGLHHLLGAGTPRRALRQLPPKPSQQLALLPEAEPTLDDGHWDTEAS